MSLKSIKVCDEYRQARNYVEAGGGQMRLKDGRVLEVECLGSKLAAHHRYWCDGGLVAEAFVLGQADYPQAWTQLLSWYAMLQLLGEVGDQQTLPKYTNHLFLTYAAFETLTELGSGNAVRELMADLAIGYLNSVGLASDQNIQLIRPEIRKEV